MLFQMLIKKFYLLQIKLEGEYNLREFYFLSEIFNLGLTNDLFYLVPIQ